MIVVGECKARSAYYALPCVYAHGIQVLHVADDDAVVVAVPHHLVLVLFPSEDRFLDEDLVYAGVGKTPGTDLLQLGFVIGYAATRSSEGVGGPDKHGVSSDDLDCFLCLSYAVNAPAEGNRFPDSFHGLFEQFSVLGHGYSLWLRSQEFYAVPIQSAVLSQL